jgi:DNA-binding MarR family transcriptional regulator
MSASVVRMPLSDPMRLPAALRGRAGFVLTRLASTARRRSSDQLAATGLSQHQHAILCCLDEFGPACQRDVAARLGLDTGDIVAFFDGLQQRELVDRRRDERDRRRQVVTITAAGRRLLREAEELLDAVEPDLLAPLSPAEAAQLRRLATRVLASQTPAAWDAAENRVSPQG